jgi:hypothetical protein
MSNTGVRDTLMRDLHDYACGRLPTPSVRIATIENWSTQVRMLGKPFKLVVRGRVYDHKEMDNGDEFCSAAVLWFDRKARFFRTTGNTYWLGAQEGDSA